MEIAGLAVTYRCRGDTSGLCGADFTTGKTGFTETSQENIPRKQPKKTTQEKGTRPSRGQEQKKAKILRFCTEPKPLLDIMQHLGLKARKNVMNVYITPMIEAGLLEMTEPDNPTSRNQMYVAAKNIEKAK